METSKFNFERFNELGLNFQARREYAESHLGPRQACGMSRCMWKFTVNGKLLALKLAKHELGIRQNIVEIKASECLQGSLYFTKILKHDPNNVWIVAELANEFNEQIFEKVSGISWFEFDQELAQGHEGLLELVKRYPTNSWLRELYDVTDSCGLSAHDFHDGNWGIVDGRPVILDYGLSRFKL
jgi:hypothetical protein